MRIVVIAPVKDRAWALGEWFAGIESQGIDDVEVLCHYSRSSDDTEKMLIDAGCELLYDHEPGRPVHEIDQHLWGRLDRYEYMARLRTELMAHAVQREPDYILSLDTDIMLPPGAVEKLVATGRPVVAPAVNMTQKGTAWNTMQWASPTCPALANRDEAPITGLVDVVMAAVLLDRDGMAVRWQAHPQGEDVGFSLDAWHRRVPLYWASEIKCPHRMRR